MGPGYILTFTTRTILLSDTAITRVQRDSAAAVSAVAATVTLQRVPVISGSHELRPR
jgi:hypothetical protein